MSEPGSRTVKDSVDQGHYAVQRIKPTPLVKREDLEDFLERFSYYIRPCRQKREGREFAYEILPLIEIKPLRRKVDRITSTWTQEMTPEEFVQNLRHEVIPTEQRHKNKEELLRCTQKAREPVEEYASRLDDLADKAFSDGEEDGKEFMKLATFMAGIRDPNLKGRCREKELKTFDEAVKWAEKLENIYGHTSSSPDENIFKLEGKAMPQSSKQQHSDLQNSRQSTLAAQQNLPHPYSNDYYPPQYRRPCQQNVQWHSRNPEVEALTCRKCRGKGHKEDRCTVRSCYTCGGIGHISYTCPNHLNFNWVQTPKVPKVPKKHRAKLQAVNYQTGRTKIVHGSCYSNTYSMLVDSGSSVSLVSVDIIKALGLNNQLLPCDIHLTSFTRSTIPTMGRITIPIDVAGDTMKHTFIATQLYDCHFLLGIDFMEQHRLVLNMKRNTLDSRFGKADLHDKPKTVGKTYHIRCGREINVPPNSICFMECYVPIKKAVYGLITPHYNTCVTRGMFVNSSISSTNKGRIFTQVLNPSDHPINITRKTLLGYLEPILIGDTVKVVKATHGDNSKEEVKDKRRWTKEKLFNELNLDNLETELNQNQLSHLKGLIWKHRSTFSTGDDDIGCCNFFKAELRLKTDCTGSWTPSRPIPYKLEGIMDRKIDEMMKSGTIEYSKTHANFNSPVFLVAKPSQPGKFRFVSDFRGINKVTVTDYFELPNMNKVLDKIGNSAIFSSFDLSSSFHQVAYTEESKPITSFTYQGRRYQFGRLVMGHKNSSAAFSRMTEKLLASIPLEHLVSFLDDILLSSSDIDTHFDYLELLLQRLKEANLKLTPKKTKLFRSELEFVGVTISKDGIRVNDKRIKAINQIKEPTTKRELQKVLGVFNWNRRWIPNYAAIAKPLYILLRKDVTFHWSGECDQALINSSTYSPKHPYSASPKLTTLTPVMNLQ